MRANQDEARQIMRSHPDQAIRFRFNRPDLVLPGGENYREVVLALPAEPYAVVPHPIMEDMFAIQKPDGTYVINPETNRPITWASRELAEQYGLRQHRRSDYTSTHFPDVPNYVAHMRLNDRTDAEGKPGLFLEEIQSDRHQQGREKGYVSEEAVKVFADAKAAKTKYVEEVIVPKYGPVPSLHGPEYKMNAYRKQFTAEEQVELDRLNDAVIDAQQKQGVTPDAPFRKDWPLQMFKRALRDAVDTGKSWIGWTNRRDAGRTI